MSDLSADQVALACGYLDQGLPEQALEVIPGQPGSVVAESIALVAQGLILERKGPVNEATDLFLRAQQLGVPLPALLRQCGRHLANAGHYGPAFECYVLLENFHSQSLREFILALPSAEMARYSPMIVKALHSGPRAALGLLRPMKLALCERLGPQAAALAFVHMTGNRPARVTRLPVASLHEFSRAHAKHYEEISPGGMIHVPALPVFGTGGHPGFETRTRTVFRCMLEDTVVSSKSNFLVCGDHALLDFQDDELEKVPVYLDVDSIVFAPEDGHVTLSIGSGAGANAMDAAFVLTGVNSFNYWHWQVEFLPRVLACLDIPGFASMPILVDQQMPPQNLQALRLCVGPDHPVRVLSPGEAVRVRRAWTCSMFVYIPLWPKPQTSHAPATFALDAQAFASQFAKLAPALAAIPSDGASKRIYLTRKDSQHRRLVNRVEIEAWFKSQGFDIVDFGEMGYAEQLRAVRNAEIIVAPNGAALINTLYARPGTRIGILDNPYDDNEWYAEVCRALGQRLLFSIGKVVAEDPVYVFNSSYEIDVGSMQAFLHELVA